MAEVTNYNNAEFCWLDLGTTDREKSKIFYSNLFGWANFEMPGEQTGGYSMFLLNQKPVAGFFPLMQEQIDMNIPSHWMSYLKTDNIATVVENVKNFGGTIVVDIQHIPTQGSMALAQTPDGGMVGFWQPESHFGSAYKNEHGSFSWFEYGCKERESAIKFFENVMGWQSQTSPMGEMLYTVFMNNGEVVAGLYELPESMCEVPAHWLPYFAVNDLDKAVEIVLENSGTILMPKLFVENVGHFAVFQDNVGAVSGLLQGV